MGLPKDFRELTALVRRVEKPFPGFVWELRVIGRGNAIEEATDIYSSEAAARAAGTGALERFKADNPNVVFFRKE